MMDDLQLKNLVLDELLWDTRVDEAHIGVIAEDGAITLSGHVKTFPEKHAAKSAVARVRGVRSIADDIEVDFRSTRRMDDGEIAKRIAHVLKWNVSIPDDDVKAVVSHGFVTLSGTVDHYHQSEHIEGQIGHVGGVTGISNQIKLRIQPKKSPVKADIDKALQRIAENVKDNIEVDVEGHTIRLNGRVKSIAERDIIHKAAWATPGVEAVINNIGVR